MKFTTKFVALATAVGFATPKSAQEIAWVHSNSAAQSEQRVKAGFKAWLAEKGNDWNVSYLDSRGSGEDDIVFLRMASHHGTRKRSDVMEDILKEYGGINVLAEHDIDITAFFEDTTNQMQDYVARFGNDIDAVWAPWDEPAQAAINVMAAVGLTDVKVIGIDGHPQAVAEVCKEDNMMIATVSQPFEGMGSQVGDGIKAIVVDGADKSAVIPSNIVYMDAPLVTKNNCKDFL
ncbi:MAG: substrate-binding domain-containing protein [Paracoccaceae bacterium]